MPSADRKATKALPTSCHSSAPSEEDVYAAGFAAGAAASVAAGAAAPAAAAAMLRLDATLTCSVASPPPLETSPSKQQKPPPPDYTPPQKVLIPNRPAPPTQPAGPVEPAGSGVFEVGAVGEAPRANGSFIPPDMRAGIALQVNGMMAEADLEVEEMPPPTSFNGYRIVNAAPPIVRAPPFAFGVLVPPPSAPERQELERSKSFSRKTSSERSDSFSRKVASQASLERSSSFSRDKKGGLLKRRLSFSRDKEKQKELAEATRLAAEQQAAELEEAARNKWSRPEATAEMDDDELEQYLAQLEITHHKEMDAFRREVE